MDINLTFSKHSLHHIGALAAACSQNITLHDIPNSILSMGPNCDKIRSQDSIICLLLNFNPIDKDLNAMLLWEARYVKPLVYGLYRGSFSNKSSVLSMLALIWDKFGNQLKPCLRPFELIMWADLYPILSTQSPLDIGTLPLDLCHWFTEIDKLVPLRRAAKIAFGDDEKESLKISMRTLPYLFIHTLKDTNVDTDTGVPLPVLAHVNIFLSGHSVITPLEAFPPTKLPRPDKRNVLITSALPYVNNVPHLGNLIGSTLSADVFSRYCRARGYNSIYVCGTDEYGTATEVKASADKVTPREICDKYHAVHAEVYQWFGIDFDVFGRTSNEEHSRLVTEIFWDIHRRGFISEDSIQQLFCESCDKFLADRFVEGGCPSCSYDDARGDQCDGCGKLINAIELINPRCKICSSAPCKRTSQHLFLDLTKIQEELEVFLHGRMNAADCIWSTSGKSITKSWLNEGLKPRCITRDLKWGVKVPLEGYQNKVFYVWFDAVLGYLSITSKYTSEWKQWWLKEESKGEVQLYQFMAKDNVPFHSVILPANLLATGKNYTMLRQLASVEYLNYENVKFSKSRNLGVFGLDAKDSGIEADIWRFYLVSSRPESQDSSFMWDDFAARNNCELLNNLGNFINRALSFLVKFFGGCIYDYHNCIEEDDGLFIAEINEQMRCYMDCMEQTKMREALSAVLNMSRLGNQYMQRNAPWVSVKEESTRHRAGTVVSVSANVVVALGVMLSPVMPNISAKIAIQCRAPEKSQQLLDDCSLRAFLQPGHLIGEVAPLFAKMEPEFIRDMKKKFGSPAQ